MPDLIVLEYMRDKNDTSTGKISLETAAGNRSVLGEFKELAWTPMLKKFCEALQKHVECRGAFRRTDREGLGTLLLSEYEEELFRTDPAKAILQRTIAPVAYKAATIRTRTSS